MSRFGDDSAEHRVASAQCLATLLHLHRGTPYVYQGEELGMTNAPFVGIEDFRDIESTQPLRRGGRRPAQDPEEVLATLRLKSRDHARTPMQWDATDQAGFTTGTPVDRGQPELPRDQRRGERRRPGLGVPPLPAAHRAPPQRARGRRTGDFTMLLADDPTVYAFTRRLDGVELLVVCNVSSEAVDVAVPDAELWTDAEVLLRSPAATRDTPAGARLDPWEARVLRRLV